MNLKQTLACVGFVSGAIFSFAAPSFAGSLTPASLGLDALDPSKPIVGDDSIVNAAPLSGFPYKAREFSFAKDTRVRFSVLNPTGLGSRGKELSSFGFLTAPVNGLGTFSTIFGEQQAYDNGSTDRKNDWLGTCGKAIEGICEVTVTFKAGINYLLALNTDGATHFGVGALNTFTFNRVSDQFYPKAGTFDTVSEVGALFIGMEDGMYRRGNSQNYYYDYQDWVVKAEAVPEPATLAGMGVVAGGMLLARRRKASAEG
jgi:hypothetical protein